MNHVITIGAAKSGSSTLHAVLGQHPEICASPEKEPNFFIFNNPRGIKQYSDIWPNWDPASHKWALESSTVYSSHPREYKIIPQRIKDYGIDPRIIYLVRNPWDKIESLMRFINTNRTPHNPVPHLQVETEFVLEANYITRLDSYSAVFDKSQILVIQFEQFIEDQAGHANRVFEFLGIDSYEITPQWELKTTVSFPEEYLNSSYRKTREQAVKNYLKPSMQRLADEWGVDIARWGY